MSFLSRIIAAKSKANFSLDGKAATSIVAKESPRIDGARKRNGNQARARVAIVIVGLTCVYAVICGRLVQFSIAKTETVSSIGPSDSLMASRPDLIDRNGEILATDIRTVSLYAEPHKIIDADEAVEQLSTVLPDIDVKGTYNKLTSKTHFQWLRRQLTPKQQNEILSLGIPGIGFRPEKRRFYPGGVTAAHVVGLVNIDNRGIAGMEKYLDNQGLADLAAVGMTNDTKMEPVKLSLDLRVQNILREELVAGKEKYQAIASAGVVLDVHTGEVIAMASIPDYDPNDPVQAQEPDRLNRMSAGTYEMGSTFKTFTTAMALDSGKVKMTDTFDATHPLYIGGFTIHDFHATRRVLTVPEVFIHSSNIGSARMADAVGTEGHKEFLTRMGLLTRLETELPEVKTPTQPHVWKKINSMTIAFGHGVSTTPLQTAVAAAALMNGGKLIPPTFLPRTQEEADKLAKVVVKPTTVTNLRTLFRLNVLDGSGRQADVSGFNVGGKTGTAEKVVHGRYSSDVRFNAFLSAFPIDNPRYVVLVVIDEPKADKPGAGVTAGSNAAPMVGAVIRRAAPLLGVKPEFGDKGSALLVSY